MLITIKRFSENDEFGGSTLGLLFVNGKFECYTLEDEDREVKVPGETRIPNGSYKIKLRTIGTHHEEYSRKFPSFHRGMLEIENIPNFSDVLIHIGNFETDTAGCILVGDGVSNNTVGRAFLSNSGDAYIRLYKKAIKALSEGEELTVTLEELWTAV